MRARSPSHGGSIKIMCFSAHLSQNTGFAKLPLTFCKMGGSVWAQWWKSCVTITGILWVKGRHTTFVTKHNTVKGTTHLQIINYYLPQTQQLPRVSTSTTTTNYTTTTTATTTTTTTTTSTTTTTTSSTTYTSTLHPNTNIDSPHARPKKSENSLSVFNCAHLKRDTAQTG